MKHWIALTVIVVLLIALIGCGDRVNGDAIVDSGGLAVATAVETSEAASPSETVRPSGEAAPGGENPLDELKKGDKPTPYPVLALIREIEGFQGGAYDGELADSKRIIYYTPLPSDDYARDYRYYDYETGDVYVNGEDGQVLYYNVFDSATYPAATEAPPGDPVDPARLKQMNGLERKLYALENVYNIEWSPDYQTIAYCQGIEYESKVYAWKASDESAVEIPVEPDTYYFQWASDSKVLLLDSGTSVLRGGQLYQVASGKLSEYFGYANEALISPNSKRVAYARTSGISSEQKNDYEVGETLELWVMDLSDFTERKLIQADDHTDYSPVQWNNDSELVYAKHDYKTDVEEELRITVSE
ncbi:hypothetical protein [Cohnella cholangitidis]|uniref:Uncharacterized protein n=1 Tax=Cohnella cholangitidis TaxID=2598458 RepID=A0A7G5BY28_9BACL|nr:hypothetical protein [Cohnella cholangitidis]QMV41862.1 hypothetical protein FPL14_12210 [Cohnella cholangitidis]